ncbi:MAG: SMP-30/gluconolactonase/LRE family protein [Chloroflexi bacterium]|nr:SMP-30/gluconolactonase/LRE family protein [Chloroflexota bacterium]
MADHPPLGLPPATDGAPVADWAPVIDDPAFETLLRPDAVLHRLATGAVWAEGPVWLAADGSVLWSDIPNDRVLRWHPDEGVSTFLAPAEYQNGHTLHHDGSIIACSHGRRRVERMGLDGSLTSIVDHLGDRRLNSPNDVVVASDGAIWFTDPPYGILSDWEGHQAESEIGDCLVFRYDPRTDDLTAVTDQLDHPNGLAFSPDESILYVSDTSPRGHTATGDAFPIVAFDVVDGRSLERPRVFYTCTTGAADGFRVDVDGNVWTSAGDGIHVVAPDGHLLGRLPVPERTANCVFGGLDGDRLFITATSSLYAIEVATRGAGPSAAQRPS